MASNITDLINFFGTRLSDRNAKFAKSRLSGFSRFLESLNSNLKPDTCNFSIQHGGFNIADQNFGKSFNPCETQFPEVFEVAELGYDLKLSKIRNCGINMADEITKSGLNLGEN